VVARCVLRDSLKRFLADVLARQYKTRAKTRFKRSVGLRILSDPRPALRGYDARSVEGGASGAGSAGHGRCGRLRPTLFEPLAFSGPRCGPRQGGAPQSAAAGDPPRATDLALDHHISFKRGVCSGQERDVQLSRPPWKTLQHLLCVGAKTGGAAPRTCGSAAQERQGWRRATAHPASAASPQWAPFRSCEGTPGELQTPPAAKLAAAGGNAAGATETCGSRITSRRRIPRGSRACGSAVKARWPAGWPPLAISNVYLSSGSPRTIAARAKGLHIEARRELISRPVPREREIEVSDA